MAAIPGFQSYVDYIGIKRHFSDPDFTWQPEAVYKRIKPSAFEKRNDQIFFAKLERTHRERRRWVENLISGFLYSTDLWIGELFEDDVMRFHQDRLGRIGSLESLFKRDCEVLDFYLFDNSTSLENVLLTAGQQDPIIVVLYQKKTISLETLVILNRFSGWLEAWNPINPLQKERRLQINKYRTLLNLASRNTLSLETSYQQLAQPRVSAHSA